MATLDATTQAEYAAEVNAADRAQVIIDALTAPVYARVYNADGTVMGEGTMTSPWATISGDKLIPTTVDGFFASAIDDWNEGWYFRFESGTRYVEFTFGLEGSDKEAVWNLATWEIGARAGIAASEVIITGNKPPAWGAAPSSLSYISGTGGAYNFSQHASDPDNDVLTYSLVGSPTSGVSINSSSGVLSISGSVSAGTISITVRASDEGGLYADHACSLTIQAAQSVSLATLRSAGYKIVTDYPGVYPNSPTQDSRAGIQAAIDECCRLGYPLYFPSGTYYVGDTLFTLQYSRNTGTVGSWASSMYHHTLVGNAQNRPVIKVLASSTAFNNTSITRPVICQRTFYGQTLNAQSYPNPYVPSWLYTDPLSITADWIDGFGVGFWHKLTNFVIDTSGKAGAIGVFWGTCQDSWMTNIKVIATGSKIAFAGLGGCHGSADLEAIGGEYGVYTGLIRQAAISSGQVGIAVRLYDQTVAAVRFSDYAANGLVGFHIRVGSGATPFDIVGGTTNTAVTTPYFIDGIVECAGQVAMTNSNNTFYARNVYVTGTSDIIKTGSLATVTGTGTWKRIVEYSARNPNGLAGGTFGSYPNRNLTHRALINGSFNSNQQVIATVESGVSSPPSDLVSKHSPASQIPWLFDGLPYVNVLDYGAVRVRPYNSDNLAISFTKGLYNDAVWASISDSAPAINAAIAAAAAAGHNRVFMPRGVYYVGSTINLGADTKLFGVGSKHSVIAVLNTWVPTTSPNYVVASASSKDGTASLTEVFICVPTIWGTRLSSGQYSGARHTKVLWRTGRRSMTWNVGTDHQYYDELQPANDRQNFVILGPNGGGRHYFLESNGRGNTFTTFRGLLMRNTTEPTSIYANNFEIFKSSNGAILAEYGTEWNMELDNCENVRIYDQKREGGAGTIRIKDCNNVAIWGPGVNMTTIHNEPWYTRTLIDGASDNILVALQTNQQANYASTDRFMLTEAITGQPEVKIPNWEGIALYKRGELNDSLMRHS